MAKIKKITPINAGEDAEKLDNSYIAGGNVKCHSHSGKYFGSFLKNKNKLNMQQPYDPAITLLDIYPKKMKTYVHTKTFT